MTHRMPGPVPARFFGVREAAPAAAAATAATRVAAAATAATAAAVLVSGCSPTHTARLDAGGRGARVPAAAYAPTMALRVMPAPYHLPVALSREVVLPFAGRTSGADNSLLIAGGLSPGATSDAVTILDPATGATRAVSRLAVPTHDSAGAELGGREYLFGGGTGSIVDTVQMITPGAGAKIVGRLPLARSDVSGVTVGSAAYLIGGYNGIAPDRYVLATTDGRHFRIAARLRVPVRYAAVAAGQGGIWVFGGKAASGATDAIQRIDTASGSVAVAGHLPQPLVGAAAVTLDGRIYVAGGATTAGSASGTVYRFDPATSSVTTAGRLPVPVAYAAAGVSGQTGYLIGGENGDHPVADVAMLRLVLVGSTRPGR